MTNYAAELTSYVNERDESNSSLCRDFKRKRSIDDGKLLSFNNQKLSPSLRCKWGLKCREMEICSFYHGYEVSLSTDFCSCTDKMCLKPHPDRAQKRKQQKVTRDFQQHVPKQHEGRSYDVKCKKCGGPHIVTECPEVLCFKCKRWGHLPTSIKCELYSHRSS